MALKRPTSPSLAVVPTAKNMVIQLEDEIYEHIARLFFEDKLIEEIDKLPILMRPKDGSSSHNRCCVYRDRAMIRYRILASLGLSLEEEDDEFRPLSSFVKEALERRKEEIKKPVLTILQEACNRCTREQYIVTDSCQNCIAKPCAQVCPKNAIDHATGRARINPDACIRCGSCMRACPFSAIVYREVPCIRACPVGAIEQFPDNRKEFHWDRCIQCGGCQRSCPFGAVMPKSQLLDVLKAIKDPSQNVVAMLAPAVAAHFAPPVTLPNILGAVAAIGFDHVLEVSIGADKTAILESEEFEERMEAYEEKKPGALPFMTTSCCPAYVACIKKYVPDIEGAISSTRTPMHYTAEIARERWPSCTTVFIGPCDSKMGEAIDSEIVDYCITFHELSAMIRAKEIDVAAQTYKDELDTGHVEGRGFPVIGGVASAVASFQGDPSKKKHPVKPVIIDGLNPEAVKRLKTFGKKPPAGNIVEVMACEGGCVAGPGAVVTANTATGRIRMVTRKSEMHPKGSNVTIDPVVFRKGQLVEKK